MDNNTCWLKDSCKGKHCHEKDNCLILYKLNYLFEQANIPVNLRKNISLFIDEDGTDKEEFILLKDIQNNITNFVNEGKNLYIWSEQTGNGKTSWALRLIQTYLKKIWLKTDLKCKALYINVPSFLLALKANISAPNSYYKHIEDNVKDCDLVIWDDIGNKVGTEFEISHLLSIIDTRISKGKSNIYTSNISPDSLGNLLDIRLASRVGVASTCVHFRGGDKRSL